MVFADTKKKRKYSDDAKTSCKYNNISQKFIIGCTKIEQESKQMLKP